MAKLMVIDCNTKIPTDTMFTKSVYYLFSNNKKSMFPLIGSLLISDITQTLFVRYTESLESDFESITYNTDMLFFNYMRIIFDLYKGIDVTLVITPEYDEISVELFLDFLYNRYGLTAQYVDEFTDEYIDATFSPVTKDILAFDLNRFSNLLLKYNLKGLTEYREISFIKGVDWYV